MSQSKTICTRRPTEQWTLEETEEIRQAFQENFDYFEAKSQSANSQGKIFFAKEHSPRLVDPAALTQYLLNHDYQTSPRPGIQIPNASSRLGIQVPNSYGAVGKFSAKNITIFPDAYLEMFPSCYRALLNLEQEGRLYDWYCVHDVQSYPRRHDDISFPILLDAQDIIHHPEVVLKYCELIGMNPEKARFAWQPESFPRSTTGVGPKCAEAVMMATLDRSTSVLKEKTPPTVDIALERKKWEEEFGEGLAKQMEKWVDHAMPDYNYLWSKRLRVN
ncbi:hypothetical protein BDV09DRAFT_190666 [Aspergillus tetrazonus]